MENVQGNDGDRPAPRRLWRAILGNLLFPPLGHFYVGRGSRGLVLWVVLAPMPLLVVIAVLRLPGLLGVAAALMLLALVFLVWIVDVGRLVRRDGPVYQATASNRWYIYASVVIASALLSGAISGGVRRFVGQAYNFRADSMRPSLHAGDRVMVDKLAYRRDGPQRNDIVVFVYPRDPSKDFLKRIVALPGESIAIRNKIVFIDDQRLDEPSAQFEPPGSDQLHEPRDNFGPLIVPEHRYFVLGDNRDHSHDSRFYGPIARAEILGRVSKIYFSWDRQNRRVRWDRIGKSIE